MNRTTLPDLNLFLDAARQAHLEVQVPHHGVVLSGHNGTVIY